MNGLFWENLLILLTSFAYFAYTVKRGFAYFAYTVKRGFAYFAYTVKRGLRNIGKKHILHIFFVLF